MLATRGTHVPAGDEWQHEVKWDGMRVLVDVRAAARRACSAATRTTRPSPSPSSTGVPVGRRAARRRGGRVRRRGCPSFARAGRADARLARRPRRARSPSGSRSTLLVFDLLRLGDRDLHGRAARRAPRDPRATSTSHDDRWQTPPAYDDGPMLFDATLPAGPRGDRQQAAHQPLPARAAQQGLAEVRPPPPRARTSSAAGAARPTRRTGSARCWSASRPPTGCSTAAGSAAASPARKAAMLREVLAGLTRDDQPVRRRGAAARRRWVRPGSSRCWSSTSSRSARPHRAGSASRRTSASAPT